MNIKVVRGNPTPEELAAALAVVRARAAAQASVPTAPEQLDEWAAKRRNVPHRSFAQPTPTTWRSSYWPR
ncbi:acyl-CoA carboxylase epsilon subunit [Streptomyces sp. MK37H]|uniref:acyl-CoA carboxylase epsilon subunit n=1 Tax=Streptomyces sp. MK37H TaxID=2699117 RepID=UPI001B37E3C1|nr:acyl-CoA carboxylase epsilon subunit [Streptomyces sp. MK37H]MBP8531733.1 acyl-CoA carboxylase subunit epsilon [Streptomyces sp. MK37H]